MKFTIGDHVVHPQLGLGYITNRTEREFTPGVKQWYYEVAIADGSTLWVAENPSESGLRILSEKNDVEQCRKILEARPIPISKDPRVRQSEQVTRLKQGTIQAQCEVVRDLYAFGENKSMYGTIGIFFKSVQNVLFEEWSAVQGISFFAAKEEIGILLEKSRAFVKKSKK